MSTPRRIVGFGLFFGIVALVCAIISSFVLPTLYPSPPLDAQAVEVAKKIKDRIVAKIKVQEYKVPIDQQSDKKYWHEKFRLAAVLTGTIAILLGTIGLARKVAFHSCVVIIGVGVAAIALEFVLGLAGAAILIAVLSAFFT
jgi:MFS superfamily sulfate permease-like transporter